MLQTVLKHQHIVIKQGSGSHSELLEASLSNGILSLSLENDLRDLMGFRHFYRHSYGFMIDSDLLNPLLTKVEGVVLKLAQELNIPLWSLTQYLDILYRLDEAFLDRYDGWGILGRLEEIKDELTDRFGLRVDMANERALHKISRKYIIPETVYVA